MMRVPSCVFRGLPRNEATFCTSALLRFQADGLDWSTRWARKRWRPRWPSRCVSRSRASLCSPWERDLCTVSAALREDLDEHSYFPRNASVAVRYARAQSCPAPSFLSTLASASAVLAGEGVHVPARVPLSSSARARVGGSRGHDSDFSKTALPCPS